MHSLWHLFKFQIKPAIANPSHWGRNIISSCCDWLQVRAQLSNGAALHCYYVLCSSFFCFYCVYVCVGRARGGDLDSATHDDFTVLSFHRPSLFRRVICPINSLYSDTSHERSVWKQHCLSVPCSLVKHTQTHRHTVLSCFISFTIIYPFLSKYKLAVLA